VQKEVRGFVLSGPVLEIKKGLRKIRQSHLLKNLMFMTCLCIEPLLCMYQRFASQRLRLLVSSPRDRDPRDRFHGGCEQLDHRDGVHFRVEDNLAMLATFACW
jgi:hypothetical protein